MSNSPDKQQLILIFEGSDIEAGILKNQLESADIPVHLKSETASALAAGFGSTGVCFVYIKHEDTERASDIVEQFKSRNS